MKHLNRFKIFEIKIPGTHKRKNSIRQMKVGEVGYTVPWAIKIDEDDECFIDGRFSTSEKGGTCCLKIKMTKDGVIAYINELPDEYKNYEYQEFDKTHFLDVVGFDDKNISINTNSPDELRAQLKQALDDEDYRKAASLRDKLNRLIKESYYEDLTPYTYGRTNYKNPVNIGWLDTPDFPKGEVDPELVQKIKNAETVERYRGSHSCPFCGNYRSSTNKEVKGVDKTYIFPEMLAHYIEVHKYLPPQEFLDAVSKMKVKDPEIQKSFSMPGFRKIKKFEGFFDFFKDKDPSEVRISVNEEMLAHLCKTGHISYEGVNIPINYDDFVQFIGGSVIDVNFKNRKYKLALQDIGLNRILHYAQNSPHFGK